MAIGRLTEVKRADGTTRLVSEVFYGSDIITPVALEPGEEIVSTQQSSTWLAQVMDGVEEPSPEDLKAEMMRIREAHQSGNYEDITDTIDDM